ncbi:MAG: aminopeptidase [Bacteroidetes bacterium]|nr:aminopeptidase [Fibrella sp.]
MVKRIGVVLLVLIALLAIWQYELVSYGWMQARGQLRVLANTKPVDAVLADPAYPDSLKQKIRLIQTIKQFAVDSLGLKPSKNYTTFYDQQGKPILWVVTASERYRLLGKEWAFPIIGTFSYKGFFEKDRADSLVADLQRQKLDTRTNEVSAWSTLGFFRDPILSSMLDRSEGSLAELIIHELTHGTLFIKNSLEYNENLADFVGEYGALRFLKAKYGPAAEPYQNYLDTKLFYERYDEHILRGARQLDSLYATFGPRMDTSVKEKYKWQLIGQIVSLTDTLTGERPTGQIKKRRVNKLNLPNNAYFIGYLTYRKQQNQFRTEFDARFKGNFTQYLTYLKQTYPSL